MPYGWHGDRIRLVPLDKSLHLENCVQWMNDPEITKWLLLGDFPLSHIAEEEWFNHACKQSSTDVFMAIELLDGTHIGTTGIHRIDFRHGVGHTGILIGRRDLWGQGYATDAMRVRSHFAFSALGLRLLMSEVIGDNTGSLRALLKCGYREVGRVPRRYWKRGAFHDATILAYERPS